MPNKNNVRDSNLNRSFTLLALRAYVSSGISVKKPVQCSDLSTSIEENGLRWKTELGDKVAVTVNSKNLTNAEIQEKCAEKQISVKEVKHHIYIESTEFNFIYIECTTEGSTYFDSVFRNLPRNGIFAITTWDDPALFARPSEPALRNYSGLITRTFYAPELAIRLIIAEMVRSAARYGKAVEVLFSVLSKSSISIIVKVRKGSSHAVDCIHQVKSLVHCIACEERTFIPYKHGFISGSPIDLLKCDCKQKPENASLQLGPVWSGPLANLEFAQNMLDCASTESMLVKTCLHQIIEETRCDSLETKNIRKPFISKPSISAEDIVNNVETNMEIDTINEDLKKRKNKCDNSEKKDAENGNSVTVELDKSGKKRFKLDKNCETELVPAPAFYYNLHKHSPKGPQLEKISKVIEILQQNGFRASRTHFDPGAIKTNANLPQLQSALTVSS